MIKRLILLLVLAGLVGGGAATYFIFTPYKGFGNEVFVDIPPGTSTRSMGQMLARAGVIQHDWQLLLVRVLARNEKLQAGEYRFANAASAWEVFRRIARGDIFYYELSVPEGSNQFDIAASLEQMGLMKTADFLKVAADPKMIRDIAPEAPTLEGYLFPATYRMTRHTTPQQLAQQMTASFRRAWKEMAPPEEISVHRVVTLASLVEKETAAPAERRMIAALFTNRLEKGMTLDCDPTTIYAAMLENRYRGAIHRSDLDSTNAYNTYKHAGLPPGPIANPGIESLKATLSPAPTDYLFFVAKPDRSGGHNFSSTLAEHNANVQAYRHGLQR